MKWRNGYGKQMDKENLKNSLIDVYRKHYAWIPVVINGDTIWLEKYYKVLKIIRSELFNISYVEESNVMNVGD